MAYRTGVGIEKFRTTVNSFVKNSPLANFFANLKLTMKFAPNLEFEAGLKGEGIDIIRDSGCCPPIIFTRREQMRAYVKWYEARPEPIFPYGIHDDFNFHDYEMAEPDLETYDRYKAELDT